MGRIALTFDDGPDPEWTPRFLEILRDRKVKATFYMIGREVERHTELAWRVKRDGHEIGNHSWSHPHMRMVSEAEVKEEIATTNALLSLLVTGEPPKGFRPPYGEIDERIDEVARSVGHRIDLWTVDSGDHAGATSLDIFNTIRKRASDNGIILFHDSRAVSVTPESLIKGLASLPLVLDLLEAEGYECVTVSELCP